MQNAVKISPGGYPPWGLSSQAYADLLRHITSPDVFRNLKKIQGKTLDTVNGTTSFEISLDGLQGTGIILGFSFHDTAATQSFSLTIGNIEIIKDVRTQVYDIDQLDTKEYFDFLYPYAQNEKLKLSVADTAANTLYWQMVYV